MNIDFDEATHKYHIDGVPVPSVTQVIGYRNDWSHIEPWRLEAARALGTDVHAAVNLMVRHALDWGTVDPVILPYVRSAAMFVQATGGAILGSELRVGSKKLGVAGTLDLLLHWNGWEYYVDWKTSAAVPSTVGIQLAAYERLYAETFRHGRKQFRARRICVRLGTDGYNVNLCSDTSDIGRFIEDIQRYKRLESEAHAFR
jgi:hypothetical protein